MMRMMVDRGGTELGRDLDSPHACCFISWSLLCTHRTCACLLLVAMLLHSNALPL